MLKRLRQWFDRRRASSEFNCAFWCPKCGDEQHYHARRYWKDGDKLRGILVAECNCGHIPGRAWSD